MNYGSEYQHKSSSLNQGEDEEGLMGSATIHQDFQQDGFPQLCEQGDNICSIKWYNEVCSGKTYTINHWLEGAPIVWA